MNAYVVKTKDMREYAEDWIDLGGDGFAALYPIMLPCQPIAPVVAETPAQAKQLFLQEFAHSRTRSGVETDDWPNLRVRLLDRDVDYAPGVWENADVLWMRLHEVEAHGGATCDCPEVEDE